MQSRTKKQLVSEESPAKSSPYRMGNWTVTMLKDELRNRQLPITGKKAELIDRLENSPVKTTAAPNNSARDSPLKNVNKTPLKSLVEDMQLKLSEKKSPLKAKSALVESPKNLELKIAESPKNSNSPKKFDSPKGSASPSALKTFADNIMSRGRSRSPHNMMTRSRSTSLTRGTFLTWSRQPFAVLGNFFMAQVDLVKENFLFFAALIGLIVSVAVLLNFNGNYRNIFVDQLTRVQPVLQVFVDGILSNLGLKRSEFSQYVSKASRFMYDCSSGNIERNSATGRLRCSAAPLKPLDGGLAGRLFWLTREQFFAWTVGTLTASLLTFLVTRKANTALPLKTRKYLNLAVRSVFLFAAFSPFEAVGLISGFANFKGFKFAILLVLKALIAVPLQFAFKVLYAKNQKFIANRLARLPAILTKFSFESSHLLLVRQILSAALYTVILAAAIQVIANSRAYKKHRN